MEAPTITNRLAEILVSLYPIIMLLSREESVGHRSNVPSRQLIHTAQSTCTSCTFKEDLSNYWTAVMFFKHRNGTYKRVPQVGNGGPQGHLEQKGGLDVYYIPSGTTISYVRFC